MVQSLTPPTGARTLKRCDGWDPWKPVTLKAEFVHNQDFETVAGAHEAVVDFIENFYNPRRRHSALGYRSPIDYEHKTRGTLAA